MRSNKLLRIVLSTALLLVTAFATTNTVYAATGSKTFTSTDTMSVTLKKGTSGDSSVATINVSGLPANAVITKLEVNTGTLKSFQGAMLTNYFTISNTNTSEKISEGDKIKTSKFLTQRANGSYKISYNCTCFNGPIIGGKLLTTGSKTYSRPSITIYWDDSF